MDKGIEYMLTRLEKIYEDYAFSDEECRGLIDAALQIIRISRMARFEGLLSLLSLLNDPDFLEYRDDYCDKYNLALLDADSFEYHLCSLLEEVTMGTDRCDIQKMGLVTMSTTNFNRVQFVKYSIWLEGAIDIQAGVHPHVLMKLLAAYLPINARKIFLREAENE